MRPPRCIYLGANPSPADVSRAFQGLHDQTWNALDGRLDGYNFASGFAGDGLAFTAQSGTTAKVLYVPILSNGTSAYIRKKAGTFFDAGTEPGLEFIVDASDATYGRICVVDKDNLSEQIISLIPEDPSTVADPGGTFKTPAGTLTLDTGGAFDVILKRNATEIARLDGTFLVTPNIVWKSGTSFKGTLDHTNTADRTYTFPDAGGTVGLIASGSGTLNTLPRFGSGPTLVDSAVTDDGTTLTSTRAKFLVSSAGTPVVELWDTSAALDAKRWQFENDNGVLTVRSVSDDGVSSSPAIYCGRTGYPNTHVGVGPKLVVGSASIALEPTNMLRVLGVTDVTVGDAVTNTVTDVLLLNHSSSGTPAASFGTGILFTGETTTTDAQNMARIQARWTTATHASRASALDFQTLTGAGALATYLTIDGAGTVFMGNTLNTGVTRCLYLGVTTTTANQDQYGQEAVLNAGYTGSSKTTAAGYFYNQARGARTTVNEGNVGIAGHAVGVTTGNNIAVRGTSSAGTRNFGIHGYCISQEAGHANVAVFGAGNNEFGPQLGGYFTISPTYPTTFPSAGLGCGNGSYSADIFIAQDGDPPVTVFRIANGGGIGLGNTTTAAPVVTVAGQIKHGTSFGAITHFLGPSDQPYQFDAANGTFYLQTGGTTRCTLTSSSILGAVTFSSPGAGTDSERYGVLAVAAGTRGVSFGYGASAAGSNSAACGYQASAAHNYVIALGSEAASTAANQFVVGSANNPIVEMYIGEGVLSGTPQATTINATGGSGSNIAGAPLTIAGGKGTGSGTPGYLDLQVTTTTGAGATVLQTLVSRIKMDGTGIGFFAATPRAKLDAIADADGTLADITTKFNSLLAGLESFGLLTA